MEDFNGYCEGCGKPFTRVPAIGWECLTTGCDYRSEESKQAVLNAIKNARKQTIAYKEGFKAGRKEQRERVKELESALLEAMEWNWLDDDAPPKFDLDDLPKVAKQ